MNFEQHTGPIKQGVRGGARAVAKTKFVRVGLRTHTGARPHMKRIGMRINARYGNGRD
jgi:hypothetical protein